MTGIRREQSQGCWEVRGVDRPRCLQNVCREMSCPSLRREETRAWS